MVTRRWLVIVVGVVLAVGGIVPATAARVLTSDTEFVGAATSGCATTAEVTISDEQVRALATANGCSGEVEVFAEAQADGKTVQDKHTGSGDLRAEAVVTGTSDYAGCAYVKIDGELMAQGSSSSGSSSSSSCPEIAWPDDPWLDLDWPDEPQSDREWSDEFWPELERSDEPRSDREWSDEFWSELERYLDDLWSADWW